MLMEVWMWSKMKNPTLDGSPPHPSRNRDTKGGKGMTVKKQNWSVGQIKVNWPIVGQHLLTPTTTHALVSSRGLQFHNAKIHPPVCFFSLCQTFFFFPSPSDVIMNEGSCPQRWRRQLAGGYKKPAIFFSCILKRWWEANSLFLQVISAVSAPQPYKSQGQFWQGKGASNWIPCPQNPSQWFQIFCPLGLLYQIAVGF